MTVTEERDVVLDPGGGLAFVVGVGATVELHQVEGRQVADLLSFDREDPDNRLSMFTSRLLNGTWLLTTGHVLRSTDGDELWDVVTDTVGENYSGGGYCNPGLNRQRFDAADAPTCEATFTRVLAPWGLTRRSFDGDTCFNPFMNVAYEPDGRFLIREPGCRAGDRIVLRARRDQLVAVSNCPQSRGPANPDGPRPLGLRVTPALAAGRPGPDLPTTPQETT